MPELSGPRGLAGRVAIVIGAASSIELASATELAAHGARVMMADTRSVVKRAVELAQQVPEQEQQRSPSHA